MKPQRPQRNTLCTPKEFPLKDITVSHRLRIISCAIEVNSTLGPGLLENVYEIKSSRSNQYSIWSIIINIFDSSEQENWAIN